MSEPITQTPTISAADVAVHVEQNDIFLLDVRAGKGTVQIYGSISYDPKKLLDAPRLVVPLPKSEGLIVLYDEDGTGSELERVAAKLRDDGYATIRILEGGFKAWRDANGKLQERTMEQPVPLVSEHELDR